MFLYIVTLCYSTLLRYVPLHCYAMFLYIVKLCSSTLLRLFYLERDSLLTLCSFIYYRDQIKQISKMLVNIHSLDHALKLSE